MRRAVLLFDLDGTLVDTARGIAVALNRLRGERGGAILPEGAVRPLVALGAEALVAHGLGELARDPRHDLAAFRGHLADVPADRAAVYAGVMPALETLAGAGWRMGVVTNKPEALARKLLDELALAAYFGAIVGGDTTAAPKPSPAPLRHALDLLGAHAGAAVMVGDSGIDAAAASACGIPFVLFTAGYGADDCAVADVVARFGRFADLPPLIARVWDLSFKRSPCSCEGRSPELEPNTISFARPCSGEGRSPGGQSIPPRLRPSPEH